MLAGCAVIRLHRGRRAQRRSALASLFPTAAPFTVSKTGCGLIVAPVDHPVQHPSVLPRGLMLDQPARFFLCACCREQVLVCSHCDRGQRYCAAGCAATTRQALQRDAGRRYQQGRTGRVLHALRNRRWRARKAALKNKVTHQGSRDVPPDAVLAALTSTPSSLLTTALTLPVQPCTIPSTSVISVPLRATTAVFPSTWRCHWCCTPCAAHVRQGFLRYSHGHSP